MAQLFLSPEQVAFRNAALLRNLRYKFPQISNYSDAAILAAYNDWSFGEDLSNEEDFIAFIEEA